MIKLEGITFVILKMLLNLLLCTYASVPPFGEDISTLFNFLTGLTYTIGKLQIAPNFLWQKPLEGPITTDVPAPGRPRNILEDPFVVRVNREQVASEILFTYDPTPGSWMYDWENDRPEDSKFAVSAGFGIEKWVNMYQSQHDDYNAILMKALADRFAEALAEYLHKMIRTDIWGYSVDEVLDNESLIAEKYTGIRPAPGYPACPDHTEKDILWRILDVEHNTGIILTESKAMFPAAAVSGWYIGHPESKYFGLGNISKDQVVDYAKRKQMDVNEIEKWLSPNLNYQ